MMKATPNLDKLLLALNTEILTTSIEVILKTATQWNLSHYVTNQNFILYIRQSFIGLHFLLAKWDTINSSARFIQTTGYSHC